MTPFNKIVLRTCVPSKKISLIKHTHNYLKCVSNKGRYKGDDTFQRNTNKTTMTIIIVTFKNDREEHEKGTQRNFTCTCLN